MAADVDEADDTTPPPLVIVVAVLARLFRLFSISRLWLWLLTDELDGLDVLLSVADAGTPATRRPFCVVVDALAITPQPAARTDLGDDVLAAAVTFECDAEARAGPWLVTPVAV